MNENNSILASIINEIKEKTKNGTYIFRGENKKYPRLECTLYRNRILKEIIREQEQKKKQADEENKEKNTPETQDETKQEVDDTRKIYLSHLRKMIFYK